MDKVYRVLQFLRVVDAESNLSITNIALMAALVRILMMSEVDTASLLAFVATLVGYQVKRVAAGFSGGTNAVDEVTELRKAIDSLKTKTSALELGSQINGRR